jgi:outer membrane receptor protein involved in Fe transport
VGGGFAEAPLNSLIGNGVPSPNNPSSPTYYSVSPPNLNLQPEKSFAFTLGTDIRLHHDTLLSFDVYRTNLFGQFYMNTTTSTITVGGTAYPLYTTQTGNLGVSRFEGILAAVQHDVPRGMYWSFSGGLTRGYVVSLPAGFYNTAGSTCNFTTNAGCTNQAVVPNVNFNGTFTCVSVPYAQGLGKIGYRWSPGRYVDLSGIYYGNNNTYFRPAFVALNGEVGYDLTKHVSLLVSFVNITGIYAGVWQVFSPANFIGMPTVSGLPNAEAGEEYGPRTILVTTKIRM